MKVFEYDEDGVATAKLNEVLLALSEGKYYCDYCPPKFSKSINVKIIALDFMNIVWKPIKVEILDKLYTERITYENTLCGEQEVVNTVPYTEDWVKLEYLENIRIHK